MEVTKGQKPTVSASTGSKWERSVGEREGGEDEGFLEPWAVTKDHRKGRARTGVRVGLGLRWRSARSAKRSHCGRQDLGLDARVAESLLKP